MAKTIAILGVPSQAGQDEDGADRGPQALRNAGLIGKLEALGYVVTDWGNIRTATENGSIGSEPTSLKNLASVVKVSQELYARLGCIFKQGSAFPIVLGGDHSISIGSVAAAAAGSDNLGVIWLDAHPDLNTIETTPSGRIHGMPLAASLGLGHPKLVNIGGFYPKVKPENVVIIGARSFDWGEKQLIREYGIKLYPMADIRRLGIRKVIRESIKYLAGRADKVHLSFDIDVLDPAAAPGVGTPCPNGMTVPECAAAMLELSRADIITSMDIVELNPRLDQNQQTASAAVALAAQLFHKDAGRAQIASFA
ncbi:MAG TPA: arginase [Firmicutes bacterium]|jgi:arginase|nr:arginase [Bacillota bacterium]